MDWSCLPGGLAMISMPLSNGSFSSTSTRLAVPPPNISTNISQKLIRTFSKVWANNFRVVSLILPITSISSALD